MHHSFLQQPNDDAGQSVPIFGLHPPSPLAQDAEQGLLWQNNPFVTKQKGRKTVQEDNCTVTVATNCDAGRTGTASRTARDFLGVMGQASKQGNRETVEVRAGSESNRTGRSFIQELTAFKRILRAHFKINE